MLLRPCGAAEDRPVEADPSCGVMRHCCPVEGCTAHFDGYLNEYQLMNHMIREHPDALLAYEAARESKRAANAAAAQRDVLRGKLRRLVWRARAERKRHAEERAAAA